jgi:adenine-specific DNA-methyltransferase
MADTPISTDHEYVLCFARQIERLRLFGLEQNEANYPLEDGMSKYRSTDLTVGMSRDMRPNQFYPIRNPRTGSEYSPSESRVWRFEKSAMAREIADHNIIWPDENESQSLTRPRYKTRFKTWSSPRIVDSV